MSFTSQITQKTLLAPLIGLLLIGCAQSHLFGQRARFADPFQTNPLPANPIQFQTPATNPPTVQGTPFGQPSIITTPPIITTTPPANVLQTPVIQSPNQFAPPTDPFSTNNLALPNFGGQLYPAPNSQPLIGSPGQVPQVQLPQGVEVLPPRFQQPQYTNPGIQLGPQSFQQNGQFGTSPLANQWPYGSAGQNWWPSVEWPSQVWARLRNDVLPRILERPRFRHLFIAGNNGNELGINDSEIATTLTIPQFLQSSQSLRISPSFTFHFWDGPDSDITGFDLPSKAYSAVIRTDFVSNPNAVSGFETTLGIGVYSDFDHLSSDSLRLTGTLLGWQRLNSYTTAKLGVEYLDRVDVKILPAVGIFMTPNADMKLDLYFPRPKLAHRVPNVGNYEVWTYVGAEYGGGSWTIERLGPLDDQVDINEVRSFIGAEWVGPRNVTGFLEFGYVFDRELVYRSDELNKLELQDALMLRTGLAF